MESAEFVNGGGMDGGSLDYAFPETTGNFGQPPSVADDDQGYSLCSNHSLSSLTSDSIFCSKNYTMPNYVENDFKDGMDLERIVSVVVPALFGIIFIVGLFGNALVVLVVASNAQMRNTTNILIINLAVADLLFIIFCVPFTAADYVLTYWPFGVVWCKMVQYLIIVTAYVSVYTLVLMSVDRFLAVVYPVPSISIRTTYNTYLAIGIIWALITVSCIPVLSAHGLSYYMYAYERHAACTFNQEYNHAAFQITFMLTSYAIPLTIICLLYFGMLFRLWKVPSVIGGSSGQRKKRVTRMVVVVVGVFAVCWLPIQVVLVLKSLKHYEITDVTVAIQITAHVLGYMNSCVNPLIYSVLSENFRRAFRKVIRCNLGRAARPAIKPRPSASHHNNHDPSGKEEMLQLRKPSAPGTTTFTSIGDDDGNGDGSDNPGTLSQECHLVTFSTTPIVTASNGTTTIWCNNNADQNIV